MFYLFRPKTTFEAKKLVIYPYLTATRKSEEFSWTPNLPQKRRYTDQELKKPARFRCPSVCNKNCPNQKCLISQVLWPLVRFPLRWPISRPSFQQHSIFCWLPKQHNSTLLFCVKFQPFSPKAAHFGIQKHPKLQFSAQWNDRNLIIRIGTS